MASQLNLNICSLDFTNKIDDYVLRKSIKKMPENSILLFEDIDHIFAPQKSHDELRHSITFSGLLNILDGVSKVKKFICVMTCNNVSILDKALLRRIDYSVEFHNGVTEEQLTAFCNELPFDIDVNKFVSFFKNKETTINIIQKWILSKLGDLFTKKAKLCDSLCEFGEFNRWYQSSSYNSNLYN